MNSHGCSAIKSSNINPNVVRHDEETLESVVSAVEKHNDNDDDDDDDAPVAEKDKIDDSENNSVPIVLNINTDDEENKTPEVFEEIPVLEKSDPIEEKSFKWQNCFTCIIM